MLFWTFDFERKKGFADFLLGHWSTKKNTNFQKILKKYFTGELQKKVQGTKRGAANHSFFTHPVCKYTGLSSSLLPNVNRAW